MTPTPENLRKSVEVYRDPRSFEAARKQIRAWWAENGIPNQFAAMSRAAEIERGDA